MRRKAGPSNPLAQPIVLAQHLLRLHLQEIKLRCRSRRQGNAVGRLQIGKRVRGRAIGEKRQRKRGDAGDGHDLAVRALSALPLTEQRRGAERAHINFA